MKRSLVVDVADNVAFVLGATIGLTLFGIGATLGIVDRTFNWVTSMFAIPPRKSQ